MLYTNTMIEQMNYNFKSFLARSDAKRQEIFQDFATFYFNDYLGIVDILQKSTLNNPFSAETLKRLEFQHIDIISKVLNRLTAGIYNPQPSRYIEIEDKNQYQIENEKFWDLLKQMNYSVKMKETFRRAKYFNTVLAMPVYNVHSKKMRLDIYNPNDIAVTTTEDYNELHSVVIRKADRTGNIYYSVWTPEQHFNIIGGKKTALEDNPKMNNPFNPIIPISTLRMKEGIDFFGEPNWNLYLNQKYFDIRLTDFDRSELNTVYQLWFGINTDFKENETFTPNTIKQVNNVSQDDREPSLNSISPNVDYTSVRENIDWKMKTMLSSAGLSANSGSTEIVDQSGVSKLIDELELQEIREEDKEVLKHFEVDLLNKIVMVNNFYAKDKINDTAKICIEFSEEKATESIENKKSRREMEKSYFYKNEVDFAMEDLNLSEAEAIERINYVKAQNKLLSENENEDNNNENENSET